MLKLSLLFLSINKEWVHDKAWITYQKEMKNKDGCATSYAIKKHLCKPQNISHNITLRSKTSYVVHRSGRRKNYGRILFFRYSLLSTSVCAIRKMLLQSWFQPHLCFDKTTYHAKCDDSADRKPVMRTAKIIVPNQKGCSQANAHTSSSYSVPNAQAYT